MGHPVWNIHINAVNTSGGNLAHTLHKDIPPLHRIRADPDIFISFPDPERGASAKNGWFAMNIALHPLRVIFKKGMFAPVRIVGNAFQSGDIDISIIIGGMGFVSNGLDRLQLSCRI